MRTIIAGSQTILDYELVKQTIKDSGFEITTVLSGDANGVDKLGAQWARDNKIGLEHYPAKWNKYGLSAGPRRNLEMADNAEALIAICKDGSKGTTHMIKTAREFGLKVFTVYIPF